MEPHIKKDLYYREGNLETSKFEHKRHAYYNGLKVMKAMPFEFEDYIHNFPCFVGALTFARFFSLKDSYDRTSGLAGHIADVGVYKGASMLFFSKLVEIYESTSLTQVHGFDWFKGNNPDTELDKGILPQSSSETFDSVSSLVKANQLEHIVRLHELDLTKDLPKFFEKYPHLQFKLVFLDTGTYKVVKSSLPAFWDRLVPGGILVLDTYNVQHTPGETIAVNEFFAGKGVEIRAFKNGWIPTAYVQKKVNPPV